MLFNYPLSLTPEKKISAAVCLFHGLKISTQKVLWYVPLLPLHIQNDFDCILVPTTGEDSGFVHWAETDVMEDEQRCVFGIAMFALSQICQHL